jgi:serine/threonine-protein kinase
MACPFCQASNGDDAAVCGACRKPLLIAARYEILEFLGGGGFGDVYKARDRLFSDIVAVKVLKSELAKTSKMVARFRREIKLARKVTHQYVCRVHEYGEGPDFGFIVMEFINGIDFRKILQREGPLPRDTAYSVAVQVAEGLQAIHDEGIVHRDLKTENIMRDVRGVVRLMDFGIARPLEEGEGLTATGMMIGSPPYMSPEQIEPSGTVDVRSDVYSFGVVVYELFTATTPFRGSIAAVLRGHLLDKPNLDVPKLPTALRPVLTKALAKDRDQRFGSAREMGEALRVARQQSLTEIPIRRQQPPPMTVSLEAVARKPLPAAAPTPVPSAQPTLLPIPGTIRPDQVFSNTRAPLPRTIPRRRGPAVSKRLLFTGLLCGLLAVSGTVFWFVFGPSEPESLPRVSEATTFGTALPSSVAEPPIAPTVPAVGSLAASLAAPTLLSPSAGAVLTTTPTLAWQPVATALGYHVMVDRNPDFLHPVLDRNSVLEPSLRLPLHDAGVYYWRVAAIDALSREGPFSSAAYFSETSPRMAGPAAQIEKSAPTTEPRPAVHADVTPSSPAPSPVAASASAAPVTLPSPSPALIAPVATALLKLRIKRFGVRVFVDDKPLGSTPLAPLRLSVGEHTLRLVHPDYQPVERVVKIEPGRTNSFPLLVFPPFDFELEHLR